MAKFAEWCAITKKTVNKHTLHLLEAHAAEHHIAVAHVASVLPGHYSDPRRIGAILRTLGKTQAAEYVATKLPRSPRGRSGDIGEILASSWVSEFTDFRIVFFKLRWKDHREMALRGDDLLAFRLDADGSLRILKGEVKSRALLSKSAITEARAALKASHGRPTPHALAFVSDRLAESGETALSDLIDSYLLVRRIPLGQVSHLLFVFSGSSPQELLAADLKAYKGKIPQHSVGVRLKTHQQFIAQVFDSVVVDASEP